MNGYHTARVSCLAWSADGVLASGGVDATIFVWDLENKKSKHKIVQAHKDGAVKALCFTKPNELASAGNDACIKRWSV